ncbi:hypothetical protein [Saccharothrix sp. NRRL B-16348]|uniref:hypothetical protein n=1 Tax=Saccharothrix sp. NRRL B-16348 TaxID=1415542 RepID=UPI000B0AAE7E|nr:hypothetical protein [Saccharothrix sp. NRRL B-16348]
MIKSTVRRTSTYLARCIASHPVQTLAWTVTVAIVVLSWPNVIYFFPGVGATDISAA